MPTPTPVADILAPQSQQSNHCIQLSPDQLVQFTRGKGLFIKGPTSEIIAFFHYNDIDNALQQHTASLVTERTHQILESIHTQPTNKIADQCQQLACDLKRYCFAGRT